MIAVDGWLEGSAAITDSLVLRVATATLVSGEPAPVEHDQVRWLSADELGDVDWLDADRPFLSAIGALLSATSTGRPGPPATVLGAWDATVTRYLGGRDNQHWLVQANGHPAVLRGSRGRLALDLGYELTVLEHLASDGWPVPRPLGGPQESGGGESWCLFSHLPGSVRHGVESLADQQERGRLLARLHLATADLSGLGQRRGWSSAPEIVDDERFDAGLARYAAYRPVEAGILRWHLDRVRERFAELDAASAPTAVLHGDLMPWNLLYVGSELTGILDFEMTHRNLRVSDFALSWRGKHDGVVSGYLDVCDLDERERALITPALWSWLMIGVADELEHLDPDVHVPTFDWTVPHLLRRSPLMGPDAAPYPG